MNILPTIKVSIAPESLAQIRSLRDYAGLGQAVARAMDDVNEQVSGAIKRGISHVGVRRGHLKFQPANRPGLDRGDLRRSIGRSRAIVVAGSDFVTVRSSVGSNRAFNSPWTEGQEAESITYAAIHEFGGTINHPARTSRMRFVSGKLSKESKYQKKKGQGITFTRRPRIGAYKQTIIARPYVWPEIQAAAGDYSLALDLRIREWSGKRGLN